MSSFSVKLHGRAGITYQEKCGSVELDSEMVNGKFDMVIYTNSGMYWDGDLSRPLATSDKFRVIENMKEYMSGKGLIIDWQ